MLRAILLVACLTVYGDDGHAQTYYRPLGNTIIGSDGSMAQPFGDGVLITQQPPRFVPPPPLPPRPVFCQRLANTVVCN